MTTDELYQFQIGDFTCTSIQDENGSPTAKQFFGNVPTNEKHLIPYADDEELDSSFNCLLIDTGSQKVLLDAGNGVDTGGDGRLLQNLNTLGISPEDIDIVVLSHAHADHYGGLLNKDGSKNFANARYIMWHDEWLAYNSPEQLQRERERENGAERLAFIETYFLPLDPHLSFIDVTSPEIAPGILAIYAPGHTHHHIGIEISSQGETILYMGDAFIHPLFARHRHWQFPFEVDGKKLAQSRDKLISLASAKDSLVHSYHFAFPGIGKFVSSEFIPISN